MPLKKITFTKTALALACGCAFSGVSFAASTIDLVVAIDESGSMSGEHNAFIGSYIENLDSILNSQNVTVNRYGLTGFGGSSGQASTPSEADRETSPSALYHSFYVSHNPDSLLGSAADFHAVTPELQTSGGTEDGFRAIDYIFSKYGNEFRSNAGVSVLLITDEDRDDDEGNLPANSVLGTPPTDQASDKAAILAQLTQRHMVLHAVVNQRFTDKQGNPAIAIVGADPDTGYAYVKDAQGVVRKVQGYILGTGFGTTDSDYTDLALTTGGTAMDIDQLRSVYQDTTALQSLSAELALLVAQISSGQQPIVGIDCSIASGVALQVCQALAGNITSSELQQVAGQIGSMTGSALLQGLNQLAPNVMGHMVHMSLLTPRKQNALIMTRLAGLRGGFAPRNTVGFDGISLPGVNLAGIGSGLDVARGGAAGADSPSKTGFFLRGSYSHSKYDTTSSGSGFSADTVAVAGGVDKELSDKTTAGVAVGYTNANGDVLDVSGQGADVNSYTVSVYASHQVAKNIYLDGVAGYGLVKFDTTRDTGFGIATGSPNGHQWQASVGVTADMPMRDSWTLYPYGRLHYTHLIVDGYTETGSPAALAYDKSRYDSFVSELGLGLGYDFMSGWKFTGDLAWEHDFDSDGRLIRTAFATDPTVVFNTTTPQDSRNYARLGLGMSKSISDQKSVLFRAESVLGRDNYQEYTFEVRYRQMF